MTSSRERAERTRAPIIYDVSQFTETPGLESNKSWLLQLKGFNRHDRIVRQNNQMSKGSLGNLHTPPISQGAILKINGLQKNARLSMVNVDTHIELEDTRGIAYVQDEDIVYIGSIDKIMAIKLSTFEMGQYLTHDEIAFAHSVTFSPVSRLGLPPALRSAFPNSALYLNDNVILATLFHDGLVKINLDNGATERVYTHLRQPHAIHFYGDGFIVTNTGEGKAVGLDKDFCPVFVIDFSALPGLDPQANGREWIQQVKPVNDHLLSVIDSNRANIYLLDLEERRKSTIPYQDNWVVQEILAIPKT